MTYVKTYLLPLKTSNMMASASRVTSSSLRLAVNVEQAVHYFHLPMQVNLTRTVLSYPFCTICVMK